MGMMMKFKCRESGQMTVEFMAMLPVLLMIAFITYNALLFFSECAAFDRVFRQTTVVQAVSPHVAYEDTLGSIDSVLQANFAHDYLEWRLAYEPISTQLVRYEATLEFIPTFFGNGAINSVFEVSLPRLTHQISLVVDPYNPGVFL